MICNRCRKEWDYEELGLSCPYCHAQAHLDATEAAALFRRAVTYEQDKKYEEALRRYTLLSLAGYPEGEEAYARCLEKGIGAPRDAARAADGYLDAAEHGSCRAAYRLGRLLSVHPRLGDGRGTPSFWFRAAAALGSADAAYALAVSGERYGLSEEERIAYLHAAAGEGHTAAIRRLCRAYRRGRGVERSAGVALWYYRTLPHPSPLMLLVFRLFLGDPSPVEPTVPLLPGRTASLFELGEEAASQGFAATALRLYLPAAEAGHTEAALRVGDAYHEGVGTPADSAAAISYYRRAEAESSAEAALILARIFEREQNDIPEAERHYLAAAECGMAEHQYILGEFYLTHNKKGEGVRRAVPWLRRAAQGGCVAAGDRLSAIDAHLAETYSRAVAAQNAGNVREAFSLFESAAALGHAASLSNLGYCLQKGLGCTADLGAAAAAYREAVAAGSEAARLNLAVCYVHGLGIRRDYAAARALLSDVAEAYRPAAEELAATIEEGRRKKRAQHLYAAAAAVYHRGDVEGAIRLRLAAAKMGSARASYMIGCHFEFGDGVPLDRDKAAVWYEAAATAGFSGSHSRLKGGYLREKRFIDSRI